MATKAGTYRKVLANFVDGLSTRKGWWYRLPRMDRVLQKDDVNVGPSKHLQPDDVLPHLGIVFGLKETAMAAILIEMSCLKKRGKKFVMNCQGWEDLQSEFKVNSMEVTQSRLDGKDYWYIRLGFPGKNPAQIWSSYKESPRQVHPPTLIDSRKTLKFVTVELVKILKGSMIFADILKEYSESILLSSNNR
jgi:hypothetical protein